MPVIHSPTFTKNNSITIIKNEDIPFLTTVQLLPGASQQDVQKQAASGLHGREEQHLHE